MGKPSTIWEKSGLGGLTIVSCGTSVDPGLAIRQVEPVGNYAYRSLFSDGHETGIYMLELLRKLGKVDNDSPRTT